MEAGTKDAPVPPKKSSRSLGEFITANWVSIALTLAGIIAGAVLGFLANEYFYVRGLEFRILEQNAEIHTLKSEKEAIAEDLKAAIFEIPRLREENRALWSRLGIKPPEPVTEPIPEGVGVTFSTIPRKGGGPESSGQIAGDVHGLKMPENYKVVIYARTDRWYVQPFQDQPLTDIDSKGHWQRETHLGSEYAALVVRPGFFPLKAPETLPPTGNDILAVASVPAK